MTKRIFSMLLIFVLLLTMIPAIAPEVDAAVTELYWPVPGYAVNKSRLYKKGSHEAIDISTGSSKKSIKGAYIIAAAGGKVVRVSNCSINHAGKTKCSCCKGKGYYGSAECCGSGTGVVIQSGGYLYSYAHMIPGSIPANVKVGATVQAGQIIGQVGDSGNAYGAHLHFSIATGKKFLDGRIDPLDTKKFTYIQTTGPVGVQYASISTKYVDAGVQVTLKSATAGATIKYTTNGQDPYKNGKTYTGPFTVSSSCNVRTVAVKDGKVSPEFSKQVTLNKSTTPVITVQTAASGFSVTIKAEDKATIYYTLNGTNPTTSSTKYTGPFTVTQTSTVKAMAVKSGKTASAVATASCSAEVPKTPTAALDSDCSATIGIADSIRFHWNAVANTYAYEYTVTCDGEEVYVGTTQSTKAAYIPTASGSYKVTVKAVNFLGSSAASTPPIAVTVKPDVTVRFVDHDGTEIESQTIHYGQDAIAPAAPSREGHTFTKWSGTYVGVKKDTTVTAVYVADTYTVKFLDREGNVLASELVEHGQAVSSVPQAPERTGYTFTGWSVKSGQGNSYTSANGNVVFEPTYTWSNPDLPVGVSIVKALRNADSTGYSLQIQAINSTDQDLTGKLISVIKTGTDKVVATKIDNITIPAGAESFTQSVSLGGSALGSVAEVYIVANDPLNDNRTGGIYAPMAKADVKMETAATVTYWSDWSEWSETPVEASETVEVETKEQYAYSDMETTTSTSSSLAGWTQNGSTVTYGAWGSWSGWTTTKHTASATKEVKTQTVYVYKHYCNDKGAIAPSTSYSNAKYGPHTLLFTSKQTHDRYSSSTGYYIADGLKKCEKYATGYYYFGTATGYQYRTRTATTNYNYYRWTALSDWSDTVYTESDTRNVQTRTLYRYRTLMSVTSTEESNVLGTEDTSGTGYQISGNLTNLAQDYSGKTAVVMIYKDKNIDPTEDQMEYIGQITIGEGNSYELTFVPKEEISEQTGNYIVSFGIATADGLINNVEIIEAPKPSYNVVFRDTEGNILSTQAVTQGQDAQAPELPELTGYDVTWNRSFTNVQADLVVRAVATAKTYNLIFVDWANDKILAIEEARYGDPITFPDDCTAEGKIFTGWSVPEGSTVTGTTVIEALYEDITFTVNFLNLDGTVFTTQQVNYGDAATLPEETPVAEGYTFVAWSTDSSWYDVKADMSVEPIFIYSETLEAPGLTSFMADEPDFDTAIVSLDITTEDATVYYTTDGTQPDENSAVYTGEFTVTETTTIRAIAVRSGMNSSDLAEYTVTVHASDMLPVAQVDAENASYNIGLDSAVLPISIENPAGYELLALHAELYTDCTLVDDNQSFQLETPVSDVAINQTFTVSNLAQDTLYTGLIGAEFAEIGMVWCEVSFTTGCDHEHSYTATTVEGDCQTEGYIQYTCHCGKTYLEDLTELGDHVYEDDICTLCGAAAPKQFELAGVTTVLGSSLSLDFVIDGNKLTGTDNYAILTRVYADGTVEEIRVDQKDWTVYNTARNLLQASYTGISAKEMGDVITAVFYNAKGRQLTVPKSDSLETYALRMLNTNAGVYNNELLRTVYVDMLNYGAAAQTQFGYNTDHLVNAQLTETQKSWATDTVDMTDSRIQGTGYAGSNLVLRDEILLNFVYKTKTTGTNFSGLYAIVTYTAHHGEAKQIRIEGENFTNYNSNAAYCQVSVTGMSIADCKQLVTCTVYNAEGVAIANATDSVESYLCRMQINIDEVGQAIMKFSTSAYAWFHRNDT